MTKLFRKISDEIPKGSVVAIGIFDGLHRGHQEILRLVREKALESSRSSILMTFEPHPEKVLRGIDSIKNITPFSEKLRLLGGQVDTVLCLNFTREFSRQSPEDFVRDYLWRPLEPKAVFVGRNFTFGRDASGRANTLNELGKRFGFEVEIVEPVRFKEQVVSSSGIRELVSTGNIESANALLGRQFYIRGIVVKGKGRKIGYPTANLRTEWELLPAKGIYAGILLMNSDSYQCVINIGTAPTFGKNELTIEAHILDFDENIYGKEIMIKFIKRFRDEKKFENIDELKKQITADIEKARSILGSSEDGDDVI